MPKRKLNNPNYARFLTWFDVYLRNIEKTHPGAYRLLESGVISVARTMIPGNLCATDKTMEETFMRFCKSKSGTCKYHYVKML